MLRVDQIRAGYGKSMVLEDLTMEVGAGELVGLMGRNGAGKTTALKTVIGQLSARAGAIHLEGTDVTRLPVHDRVRRGIGYVPQGRHIFPTLSVRDNIRVAAHGAGLKAWRDVVERTFEELPVLRDKAAQPGGQLSGGQQQLLAIARALVSSPRLLLLDEPSEGLQPSIIHQIAQVISDLSVNRGIAVLLVEQNLDFATGLVTRVCIMDNGQIVLSDRAESIKGNVDLQHEFLGL
jgi:urea ABC transporter ATP-binding protein UrtE